MLKFMQAIQAHRNSQVLACQLNRLNQDAQTLTYRDMWLAVDQLAGWLHETLGQDRSPLVVYGHKHPYMLVYFLACLKSGHAYCPIDLSMPLDRVATIIEKLAPPLVLTTEDLPLDCRQVTLAQAQALVQAGSYDAPADDLAVKGFETAYIIYTSGSTGQPKGVCVSAENLDNFLTWYLPLIPAQPGESPVFIGQPPYSFDLSVMSVYPALCMGATLYQLDKGLLSNYGALFDCLKQSGISTWVSTPSFVDTCLADPQFNQELLPQVRRFAFCGEKLQARTAQALLDRFPLAKVYNSYGPTESTVMMTWVDIDQALIDAYPDNLPVGRVRPGSLVQLLPLEEAEEGQGEIQIIGDTVAQGYYGQPELTAQKFGQVGGQPAYKTGDVGYFEEDLLFCNGRIDFQIKWHGYRIELEDIDANLIKHPLVSQAITLPKYEGDTVRSLVSFVIYDQVIQQRFQTVRELKAHLKQTLPDYMIPKKIVFLDSLPLNQNGKVDRKALGGLL